MSTTEPKGFLIFTNPNDGHMTKCLTLKTVPETTDQPKSFGNSASLTSHPGISAQSHILGEQRLQIPTKIHNLTITNLTSHHWCWRLIGSHGNVWSWSC